MDKSDFINDLIRIKNKYPELRLGQIIASALSREEDIYYVQDEKLIKGIRDFSNYLNRL